MRRRLRIALAVIAGLLGTAITGSAGLGKPVQPIPASTCPTVQAEIDSVYAAQSNIKIVRLGPDQVVALRAWEKARGLDHAWTDAWLLYKPDGYGNIKAGLGFALGECSAGWTGIDLDVVRDVLGVNLVARQ